MCVRQRKTGLQLALVAMALIAACSGREAPSVASNATEPTPAASTQASETAFVEFSSLAGLRRFVGGPTRTQERDRLLRAMGTRPGWTFHETGHYFIVTSVVDAAFIDELKLRCESIRAAIRVDFPHPDVDPVPLDTAPNVVRVCKDSSQFSNYGGPGWSFGYWSPMDGEVVLYDSRGSGDRGKTWSGLNAMLLFEYLSTLYADPQPPAWFTHGHSDYYGGFRLVDGEYHVEPCAQRVEKARELARRSLSKPGTGLVPLEQFLRFDQQRYYGSSKWGTDGSDHFAQSWPLV